MRWLIPASSLVLLSLLAGPGGATAAQEGRAGDLAALEAQFEQAHAAWKEANREARRAGVRLSERPVDPTGAYWPRFEALLEAGQGRAALWLVEHAKDADLERDERKQRQVAAVARAFGAHAGEPWLEELCFLLMKRKRDFEPEALASPLRSWLAGPLAPPVRAAGHLLEAEVIGWNRREERERRAELGAALQAALQAAPTSEAGRKAGGQLYRALEAELQEQLQPWLERAEGEEVARPDLAPWRTRFGGLAEAGVEQAEVWLLGTAWIDEPDADRERLLTLLSRAEKDHRERIAEAQAEAEREAEAEGAEPGPMDVSDRLMALYLNPPNKGFWVAFEDLADRDPRAVAWLVQNVSSAPGGPQAGQDRLLRRLERVVREHGDEEWTVELADALRRGGEDALGAERHRELCARWADATSNEEVEVRLRYLLAEACLEEDQEEGLALLGALAERWPDHDLAKQARGRIAGLTQLAIGKVAPEIEGPDLNGVEFKLSDYRGKVVVLDFWGDW